MKTVVLSCFLLLFSCFFSEAKTIEVCSDCKVKQLATALDLAADYDTILVKKGTYISVNTEIKKQVVIIGEEFPVFDGQEKDEVLVVKADNVSLSGIFIKNSKRGSMKDYAGIRVVDSRNVQIINCKLENTFFGIYLANSKNCLISGNHSKGANYGNSDTGNGVQLWKCDSIKIENNHMEGHRDGIYFEFAHFCLIEKNLCERNFRYGLHFMFSDSDVYRNNTFQNNGTGVAVMYTKNVEMYDNTFQNNWGDAAYGLLLKDISNSIIEGNTFTNNTVGVTMEGSNMITFSKNNFASNGYALKVMANCIRDTFMYNNFTANTFDAATNGELRENSFMYNYWDKYEGYDLNRDKIGDVPFRPVSLYSMIIEQMPYAVMLLRSFTVEILNRAEKSIPGIVPETFQDYAPMMKPNAL